MNKLYKIEFFQFRTPGVFTILKEGDGDNLGDGKFSGFHNFRFSNLQNGDFPKRSFPFHL